MPGWLRVCRANGLGEGGVTLSWGSESACRNVVLRYNDYGSPPTSNMRARAQARERDLKQISKRLEDTRMIKTRAIMIGVVNELILTIFTPGSISVCISLFLH